MRTQDALDLYLKDAEKRGLSDSTRRTYQSFLRHFVSEYAELPLDTGTIERFLRARKETPAHRGEVFKHLQGFYSFLARSQGITSPVPPRGKMGRPRKVIVVQNEAPPSVFSAQPQISEKVVQGGVFRIELHVYLHTVGDGGVPADRQDNPEVPVNKDR